MVHARISFFTIRIRRFAQFFSRNSRTDVNIVKISWSFAPLIFFSPYVNTPLMTEFDPTLMPYKSLRILPSVISLRAVGEQVVAFVSSQSVPSCSPDLIFHFKSFFFSYVFFVIYFYPARARKFSRFAFSLIKLCLKKYRSPPPQIKKKRDRILQY
jgi:hypothetical protein